MNYDFGVGGRHTYRSPGIYHLSATVTETMTGRVKHLSRDIEIPKPRPTHHAKAPPSGPDRDSRALMREGGGDPAKHNSAVAPRNEE